MTIQKILLVKNVRAVFPLMILLFALTSACASAQPKSDEISLAEPADQLNTSIQGEQELPKEAPPGSESVSESDLAAMGTLVEKSKPSSADAVAYQENSDPANLAETPLETNQEATVGQIISQPVEDVSNLPVGPRIGNLAPDFSLQTLDGQTIRLSELRGRPVLLSYWASWCDPCINEMQILQKIYQQYQDQGFVILSINAISQDSPGEVGTTVDRLGVTFPVLLDEGNMFADSYQALFFPTTFFVDSNGVIRDIALGDSPEAEFNARVMRFLTGVTQ